jgi:hypothetical protein
LGTQTQCTALRIAVLCANDFAPSINGSRSAPCFLALAGDYQGYCPGPALVSLLYGYESTMIFCLAMFAGMLMEAALKRSKIA